MAALKTVFYLGVCLSAFIITTADTNITPPKAENIHWMSQDFKTILTWTATPSNYTYTVRFAAGDRDWIDTPDCIQVSHLECDLTHVLEPFDRSYTADIRTEPLDPDYDYDLEELPHTVTQPFNPYRQSNISAVEFTVETVDGTRAILNITDPLTGIHRSGKQLTIRDVLRKDLKYKISYYKAGSTGKRENISDSSIAEVSGLDAGHSYCFMVAAFIPSRPKNSQNGALSEQKCTGGGKDDVIQELSIGAWVGIIFILLTVLIIIVTVTVLCCKCCRQRNKSLQTSQQSSAPI